MTTRITLRSFAETKILHMDIMQSMFHFLRSAVEPLHSYLRQISSGQRRINENLTYMMLDSRRCIRLCPPHFSCFFSCSTTLEVHVSDCMFFLKISSTLRLQRGPPSTYLVISPGSCITEPKATLPKVTMERIGHFRNVRGLGKSMVVFRLFEKLKYSNERSTIF